MGFLEKKFYIWYYYITTRKQRECYLLLKDLKDVISANAVKKISI